MWTSLLGTFQNQQKPKKRLWLRYGGFRQVSSTTVSYKRAKPSRQTLLPRNKTNVLKSIAAAASNIKQKRPGLVACQCVNTSQQQITLRKSRELHVEVLPHLFYYPDLAQKDYHVFKHLKSNISGKIFAN